MKVIFHFNCVICGAHPKERNIKDFEWPPSSERLERLLSVVKGIFSYMKDVKWWEADFVESLKKLHDLIPVVAATGLNTFQGSLTLFNVECPLCGTAPGPRPLDSYFRAWFAPDWVQIANLLYEMWYLLRKIPETAYLVAAFDTAIVKFGMQRCSKCGRPTTSLDDGRCRWCRDEERKDNISNLRISDEADNEYIAFLQSLEGHDLLGAGNDGWEAVRAALIQDMKTGGHGEYLLMALACHPVSIWLEPWRSVLDCENCAPREWRDPLLLNPPHLPPDLDKLWEKCHDLPVEAKQALHAVHALRWQISPYLADYLESRGLIVRGSPDDFSCFLEHLSINRIREISNQLGTGKGRSKADIISKVLTNASQEQLSIILPEINEPWIKEFRKPFDGLPEEWLKYVASVATLIEAFVREKFMTWEKVKYTKENRPGFVVDIDWDCPSYCRLPERRVENKVNISIKDVPPWFPGCGCFLKYDSIPGNEIKTKLELSITTGKTVEIVEYNDSSAKIELLNLYGSISKSADGQYCLMYSEGWWLLIESNIIKAMGHMAQPNHGAVANNGTFILTDYKYRRYRQYKKKFLGEEYVFNIPNHLKGGIFWVIGNSGQPLIRRTCTANIGSACISPEGGFAACSLELDDANTADSETVVLFDLNLRKQISQFKPAGLHVDRIEIDENERVIKATNYNDKTFRFNFNGELFDIDLLQKENIENANGYYLITLVEREMENELAKEKEIQCLGFLDKALEKGVSPYWRGKAYAMMGQINEKAERFDEAVKLYETALQWNTKLGIKRHLKQLKDRLQIIETKKDA